ncbi:hypothetical protein ANCCAN_12623 [Ancylostoma caninum]|uniref:Uncharacterized protein n=1 Tax=Ancylostoma caninum TaxID=29170 RepID=A0A368GEE8_ANCCA|nr:hypothetical protein ANCCAN_12623 [Ancylostoma caninum]
MVSDQLFLLRDVFALNCSALCYCATTTNLHLIPPIGFCIIKIMRAALMILAFFCIASVMGQWMPGMMGPGMMGMGMMGPYGMMGPMGMGMSPYGIMARNQARGAMVGAMMGSMLGKKKK